MPEQDTRPGWKIAAEAVRVALSASPAPQPRWKLVPVEPTEAWVYRLANIRQGQRGSPRCEAPSGTDKRVARDMIALVLSASPAPQSGCQLSVALLAKAASLRQTVEAAQGNDSGWFDAMPPEMIESMEADAKLFSDAAATLASPVPQVGEGVEARVAECIARAFNTLTPLVKAAPTEAEAAKRAQAVIVEAANTVLRIVSVGEGATSGYIVPTEEAEAFRQLQALRDRWPKQWAEVWARVDEENCPGHVASRTDPKVCGRCGIHINSLRPPEDFEP